MADLHKINEELQKIHNEERSKLAEMTPSENFVHDSFQHAFASIDKLISLTGPIRQLRKQIEEIGGDPSYIIQLNKDLEELYSKFEEAHQGAMAHVDMDESATEEECSACHGTGWDQSVTPDEDDRGCDECNGTGKIEEMFSTRSLGLKGASKRSKEKARNKDKEKEQEKSKKNHDIEEDEGASVLTSPEHFQQADAANMRHAKEMLEKLIRELNVDILWRSHNSDKFFNSGDRAGTGHLQGIADKLQDINKNWDKETELYGM